MDDRKDTQSDTVKSREKEMGETGNFFKKYTLPAEPDASSRAIFRKYVPPRADSDENADQPSATETDLSKIPGASKRGAAVPLMWAVAFAVLILGGWLVLQNVLNVQGRRIQQAGGDTPPAEMPSEAGTSGQEPSSTSTPGSLDSATAEVLDSAPRLTRTRYSPGISSNFLHNVMLARAREFEDRGMLSRAEQEYQTISSSFPNDTFSQFRLSRVQSVLSTKRQNELSRISREAGLRAFRMSDYASAEKDLVAAVDAGRRDTATLYALGMSYVKLGHYAKAQEALDQCIAANPDYAPALVALAQANAAAGKQDQAVSLLERALELGGGAEFTPAKIKEMISGLVPARTAPSPSARSSVPQKRSEPTFFARAVHGHAFPLTWCTGDLEIINSVVHFSASKPSHSFQVLSSQISGSQVIGNELHFNVNGRAYSFTLKGRSPIAFLDALRR